MHEKYPGISSTFKIPLDEKHYIKVFVWEDVDSMHATHNKVYPNNIHREKYVGCCIESTGAIFKETGKQVMPPKFAEIHISVDRIGGGYIAHELQHAINYWAYFKNWTVDANDEQIAKIAGDLTNSFWKTFYSKYSREPA